jgi:hypothetical protein
MVSEICSPHFFSPKKSSKVIWGVGPQLLLPTATKTGILGQGKFGMGPTAVVLVQPGKWTLGFLINNVWSVAGHAGLPDVNPFLLNISSTTTCRRVGISLGNPPSPPTGK